MFWSTKAFGPGQIYTALSRVKTYDNHYCLGEFKQNDLIFTLKKVFNDIKKEFITHQNPLLFNFKINVKGIMRKAVQPEDSVRSDVSSMSAST